MTAPGFSSGLKATPGHCRGVANREIHIHVLVSEIMLQQTQVDRVAPRFVSFVERFPSLADLASAREEDVVAEWSGLGYYRRARMLHRLAREVAAGSGALPATVRDLAEASRDRQLHRGGGGVDGVW